MLCSRLWSPVVHDLFGRIIRLWTPVVSRSPWRNHPALVRFFSIIDVSLLWRILEFVLEFRSRVELAVMFRWCLVVWARRRSRFIRLMIFEIQVCVRRYWIVCSSNTVVGSLFSSCGLSSRKFPVFKCFGWSVMISVGEDDRGVCHRCVSGVKRWIPAFRRLGLRRWSSRRRKRWWFWDACHPR